jgi:gas vesicle protein
MKDTNQLFFFLIGVSVGVVATLLIAPYSGEETRQFLRERVDEGRERAGEVFERGKDLVERQGEALSSAIGYGRKSHPRGVFRSWLHH